MINDFKLEVIETRKISQDEYNYMLNILKKNNMPSDNFIKNCQTLVINKIDSKWYLLNGYDAEKNILYYNEKSNLKRELFHIASSTRAKEQGIVVKARKFYPKSRGFALNEGITDMFLELTTGEEGFFILEKLCAKLLVYTYGIDLFKAYFQNDDLTLRETIGNGYTTFLLNLDDYCDTMTKVKKSHELKMPIPKETNDILRIYAENALEDLLNIVKDSQKDYKSYLKELLKSKEMKQIYDFIGEFVLNFD